MKDHSRIAIVWVNLCVVRIVAFASAGKVTIAPVNPAVVAVISLEVLLSESISQMKFAVGTPGKRVTVHGVTFEVWPSTIFEWSEVLKFLVCLNLLSYPRTVLEECATTLFALVV